jgi:hypothetical protein
LGRGFVDGWLVVLLIDVERESESEGESDSERVFDDKGLGWGNGCVGVSADFFMWVGFCDVL